MIKHPHSASPRLYPLSSGLLYGQNHFSILTEMKVYQRKIITPISSQGTIPGLQGAEQPKGLLGVIVLALHPLRTEAIV